MTAAFFDTVRSKVAAANLKLSTPATFLDVNATESLDVETGVVTLTGGESVVVTAFPPGPADRSSVQQGLAAEGQQMFGVRAESLVRSGAQLFEPRLGQRVILHGTTWIIDRVSALRDEAGAAIVFFLALRS